MCAAGTAGEDEHGTQESKGPTGNGDQEAFGHRQLIVRHSYPSPRKTQKPLTESQLTDYFNSAIRESNDPAKWAPTFKLTVPQDKDGKPQVEVFDDQEKKVSWDDFEAKLKDSEFACIFKASSIYFLPK